MNDTQENKLSMYNKVGSFLDDHVAELAAIPAIATVELLFDQTRLDIVDNEEEASEDTTGYALDKAQKQETLIAAILRAASAVESHATITGEYPLAKRINFTRSELGAMRDMYLLAPADLTYETASPLMASLGAYGYNAVDIANFDIARNAYRAVVTKPKEKIEDKMVAGRAVDLLFEKGDRELSTLDVLMKNFNTGTTVLLYFEYQLARKIDDAAGPGGGTGGSTQVWEGAVAMMTFATAGPFTYNAATPVLLENTGDTSLDFQLVLGGFGGASLMLMPHTELATTLGSMGANGDTIRINNTSPMPGSYKVTLG